jgi:hypothetical protein
MGASANTHAKSKLQLGLTARPVDDVGARLDALEKKLDAALALLGRVAGVYGPRDHADVAIVPHLARVFGARPFTSKLVLRHARVDADLRGALQSADVETARQLGWVLRAVQGIDVADFRVDRVRVSTAGHTWRVSVSLDPNRRRGDVS